MPKAKRWYSPRFKRNLLACYTRACNADFSEGLTWYARANKTAREYATRYNVSHTAACGVIAALSPGRNWESNLQDAETFLDEWANGARGKRLPLVGSYGWRNVVKASKIASGKDPLAVLGGNKVRAFYACILNPETCPEVCIDRHAKCAAHGVRLGDTIVSNAEYPKLARHYELCAREVGILPHQFQAIVWVVWRRLSGNLAQQNLYTDTEVIA